MAASGVWQARGRCTLVTTASTSRGSRGWRSFRRRWAAGLRCLCRHSSAGLRGHDPGGLSRGRQYGAGGRAGNHWQRPRGLRLPALRRCPRARSCARCWRIGGGLRVWVTPSRSGYSHRARGLDRTYEVAKSRRWLRILGAVIWLVAIAAGVALADGSIVTLALPQLLRELGTSVEGVAAVLGVYCAVVAVVLPPSGQSCVRS